MTGTLEGLAAISGFCAGSGGESTRGDVGKTSAGGFSSSSRTKGGGREVFLAVNGALMKGLALEEEEALAAVLEGVRNL